MSHFASRLLPRRCLPGVALAILCGGCGYSLGYRVPDSVETIAVPMFDNQTFPLRREVELDLTAEVRKELQARTPLRLVDSSDADMVVYGTVKEFRERLVAEGRLDEKTESTVVILVRLIIEDYRNGTRREESVSVREPLSVQAGETLDQARSRAIRNLAEKVVEQVEVWGEP